MPELPEVETIVRELKPHIIGKKFWNVDAGLANVFLPSFQLMKQKLPGLRVLNVFRRGKFIVFELENSWKLVIHLRMTGRLMWKKKVGRNISGRFLPLPMRGHLFFRMPENLARVWLATGKDYEQMTGISRLGLEPLSPHFKPEVLNKLFIRKRGILKNTLLRQDLIARIGNIYADEICYRIGVHPSSRLEKLSKDDVKKLYEAIRHCLEQGIEHCGASVSDFVGTRGTLGKHQKYLQVYGRKGDPCYSCQEIITKTKVAGRGTFVCKQCQVVL
ncbi:MAG: bifunctional DNA-formamidopyrimidine glycosylase/DNA-(apurinic or apyrimidinic site) lyase [Candidatus Gracilibacteria bacterium]